MDFAAIETMTAAPGWYAHASPPRWREDQSGGVHYPLVAWALVTERRTDGVHRRIVGLVVDPDDEETQARFIEAEELRGFSHYQHDLQGAPS
jgi:hypothetical protein